MGSEDLLEQFQSALKSIGYDILRYDPSKQRSVKTGSGSMTLEKFQKAVISSLGANAVDYPAVFKKIHSVAGIKELVESLAEETSVYASRGSQEVPEEFKKLTLNLDVSYTGQHRRYFLTTENDFVSDISGPAYIGVMQIKEADAAQMARKVYPKYLPRSPKGIISKLDEYGEDKSYFNVYGPPPWTLIEDDDIPDRLPKLFKKLVVHLFPLKEEREFFFSWLYHSMYKRAFTYLVLCGAPGTGKNRLKLVMRALHGHANTTDGKKSTLTDRFNSQLEGSTLIWFDELRYDADMENVMKEIQNDSVSIERKGIDATRSTAIHASLVISNNKPRDNYIAFDARKFVPLKVSDKRLEESMTPEEIAMLSRKVEDWGSPKYDLKFIAQIGRWIKKHGKSKKWPNLEYKGPMFWTLAHTSMSRWQKKAASIILEYGTTPPARVTYTDDKGFLWSTVHELAQRKHGDKSLQFPDFTTVKHFFDTFRDSKGRIAFSTESLKGDIMGDFWVKSKFDNIDIITEDAILSKRGKQVEEDQEYLDL